MCKCNAVYECCNCKEEKPKFDPTKPVQTRDGRKARIICNGINNPSYNMAAVVAEHDGAENVSIYGAQGEFYVNVREPSDSDLVNIPEERWVNLYEAQNSIWKFGGSLFDSKQAADDGQGTLHKRVACIKLPDER